MVMGDRFKDDKAQAEKVREDKAREDKAREEKTRGEGTDKGGALDEDSIVKASLEAQDRAEKEAEERDGEYRGTARPLNPTVPENPDQGSDQDIDQEPVKDEPEKPKK